MKNLHLETLSYNMSISLSVKAFLFLESLDFLGVVQPALKEAGASEINYDGHFGPHVFFTVENENDAKKVLTVLEKLLTL